MNLPQLDNLIHYVNLMCYANFMCFVYRISYHFSHSINDYSCILYSILYYKLLPMFMIHVSFIHISSSLFTCFMPTFFKEVDTGKDCMYPRVLSLYVTVISICTVLCDPNRVTIMTQTGLTIFVCYNNCIPNRHVHLSIYLVISRQSVLLRFQYISHIHE